MLAATTPTIIINCEKAGDELFTDVKRLRCEIRQRSTLLQIDYEPDSSTSPIAIQGKIVRIHLTQEQTAKFIRGDVKIQLHFLLADGTAWKTIPAVIKVSESLTQEVIE